MIGAQNDSTIQENLIERFMSLPNQTWDAIIAEASNNLTVLHDIVRIKQIVGILKTNIRACKAIGSGFLIQLGGIIVL